jgi:predicted nucleic acid-binding protein
LHRLATGKASLDSSVIVDFYLVGRIALLEELFSGRMVISDFVRQELIDANLQLTSVETVALSTNEEWEFFQKLRRDRPGLGPGELGALCVARSQGAILLTNDRQARIAAEESGISVHGGLGVLEYAVEAGRLSGPEAVKALEEMIGQGAWISEELAQQFRQRILHTQ